MILDAEKLDSVFPAPAGVILFAVTPVSPLIGFPRTCGGDPAADYSYTADSSFSPHLRG